jgi:hypothetical protein
LCQCGHSFAGNEPFAGNAMQGGVIRKRPEWRVRFKAFLLAVEDPIVPGKDISSGTYQIQRVSLSSRDASPMDAFPCTLNYLAPEQLAGPHYRAAGGNCRAVLDTIWLCPGGGLVRGVG